VALMPELRKDPVVGRWVIIATERARRPQDFAVEHDAADARTCPFCPGAEERTPREVLAYRAPGGAPNGPGWSVRVVPNRYPALMVEGDLDKKGRGVYDRMNGVGAHEVVIETPHHERALGDLSAGEIEAVLAAWRDRMLDLSKDGRFRYLLAFKNHGSAAGSTVGHAHSQIIALPVIPATVRDELAGGRAHWDRRDRCIWCDVVEQELSEGDGGRVVLANDQFVAVCPWAARSPFECCVLPRRHAAAFEHEPRASYGALAEVLRAVLRKVDGALDRPPYHLMLHTAPLGERDLPHFHWHLELMPVLGTVAGFEWGSGFHINPVAPESAAEFLRKVTA
jgi:UDPglucose--hexose-1-phosphate uridylyltransferase